MEKTFVLKNVPYAAKKGGGTITKAEEAHLLDVGAVAVFLDGKVVSSVNVSEINESSRMSIGVGYPTSSRDVRGSQNVRLSASFCPKNVLRVNTTEPVAGVAKAVVISGFTDTVGEAMIRLYHKTYDVSNNLQRLSVSLTRREGETLDAFVDRVVAKFSTNVINAGFNPQNNNIATATKVTNNSVVGIKFTALSPAIDFDIAVDGIFEGAVKTVTTQQVAPVGAGIDVVKDEQDSTPMFGDSGYEYNDYFNRVGNAEVSLEYKAINVDIQRVHSSPTNRQNSMVSNITIYAAEGVTALDTLATIFNVLGNNPDAPGT